jgi:predicted dehydrogenase
LLAAAATGVAAEFPFVPKAAAEDALPIRVGIVGCGGRGTGAAGNVLDAAKNVQVVALADLFPDRLEACRQELKRIGVTVEDSRCFTGFDGCKQLLGIPEVNYVILATSPHFRPQHLRAVIDAGKHCFVEKPVAVDSPGVRSVIESGEFASKKNLGILAGTQRRHQNDYQDTIRRLQDGAAGDILAAQAYFNTGSLWHHGRKPEWSEMEYQCRNWYYYTWLSGDHIVEQHVHNLDMINWLLKAHPIRASGMGGRQSRTDPKYGHIYDHFAIEFEYPNGVRLFSYCRQMDGCEGKVTDGVIATRGTSNCRNLIQVKGEKTWRFLEKANQGHLQEHLDFIQSIRAGNPLNEARQVAESTLTAIIGREAAYSGLTIEWDAALKSDRKMAPEKYELTAEPPKSEVAIPGRYKFG